MNDQMKLLHTFLRTLFSGPSIFYTFCHYLYKSIWNVFFFLLWLFSQNYEFIVYVNLLYACFIPKSKQCNQLPVFQHSFLLASLNMVLRFLDSKNSVLVLYWNSFKAKDIRKDTMAWLLVSDTINAYFITWKYE